MIDPVAPGEKIRSVWGNAVASELNDATDGLVDTNADVAALDASLNATNVTVAGLATGVAEASKRIAGVTATASVTVAASPSITTVLTFPATAYTAGRRYRISVSIHQTSSVAGDVFQWVIFAGATPLVVVQNVQVQAGTPQVLSFFTETVALSGTVTLTVQGKRVTGSGGCSMYADGSLIASAVVDRV